MTKKLVQGMGINDANYVTNPTINGKKQICKFYNTWVGLLRRCYRPKFLEKQPSYVGSSISEDWLSFMAFRAWMLEQEYEEKHLDKDLLVKGNKIYSKDTCVFISPALNNFMTERLAARGELPIGVSANDNNYVARCSNPFTKTSKCLGTFKTPEEAHLAWKAYKHKLALQYAELESDQRIIQALQTRYL